MHTRTLAIGGAVIAVLIAALLTFCRAVPTPAAPTKGPQWTATPGTTAVTETPSPAA